MPRFIEWIKDHLSPFWKGAASSFVFWGSLLFADVSITWKDILLRIFLAGMISFISGIMVAFSADFYKEAKLQLKRIKDAKRQKKLDKRNAA